MNSNIAVIQYPSPRQRRRIAVMGVGIMVMMTAGVAVGRTSHQQSSLPPALAERLSPGLDLPLVNDATLGASAADVNPAVAPWVTQSQLPSIVRAADICMGGLGWACIFTAVPELPSVVMAADICMGGLGWACVVTPQLPDQR